jgi:hypothetical protein
MATRRSNAIDRSDRVRLILQVRRTQRRFFELMQSYRGDSLLMWKALVQTRRQLSSENRELALAALRSEFQGLS